ncbi:MAG: biopolymer transport protein ExbB [Verrucomicrobiales bacterium]|jgi:biopolymer transport protein ExbB
MLVKNPSNRTWWLIGLSLLVVTFFMMTPELAAQADGADAAAATDGADGDGEEKKDGSFLDEIKKGGLWMGVLGLLSVVLVTLIVFNLLQMMGGKFTPKVLQMQILDLMAQVRVRSAIETAAASPSFLGRMLASALPNVDATDPETLGREDVEDAIADFTTRETGSYMNWISYISVVAQMAPMVGLLGTVSGMIKAFATLGIGKGSNASALANNISEALYTTAGGLVVALPALVFYVIFRNWLASNIGNAHKAASDAMDAALATVNAESQMAKVPEGLAE